MVNPHQSLLLGSNNIIETPGEIDGLLDDYFDSTGHSDTMPYDNFTGEFSTSQQSLHTTSSNGRQRVLYKDPESARRTILGIHGTARQSTNDRYQYDGSPLSHKDNGLDFEFSDPNLPEPASPSRYSTFINQEQVPRRLQIHRNLREALRMGASTEPCGNEDEYELKVLDRGFEAHTINESDEAHEGYEIGNRGNVIAMLLTPLALC